MNVLRWSKKLRGGFAMRTKGALIVIAIVAAGICGCSVPKTEYYQLKAPSESGTAAGDALPITLLVGPLRASHLYREDRIVFATSTDEMGTYQNHRWAEAPTEMIQQLLRRSLMASHRFNSVLMLSSGSRGDFLLEGNIYDFKEVSGSALVGRMSAQLELHDVKTGAIVWTHSYDHDERVSGKSVSAVVAALDQNAQEFVSDAEASLNEYFAAHPAH